jgi:hypothetical protein
VFNLRMCCTGPGKLTASITQHHRFTASSSRHLQFTRYHTSKRITLHALHLPANITGKTPSFWHTAGRGNKHNAARAKLRAAHSRHMHTAAYWHGTPPRAFNIFYKLSHRVDAKTRRIAASTIYHSRGNKTARGLFPVPLLTSSLLLLYLWWSRCLSRSKKECEHVVCSHFEGRSVAGRPWWGCPFISIRRWFPSEATTWWIQYSKLGNIQSTGRKREHSETLKS